MNDLSAWPALVLTAGIATRLRPVSTVRAKAGMPVAGKPLIGRILEWLAAAGVRRVVLNLHHRPETITRTVGDGAEWGVEVQYSWEAQVLGSAGGPRRALSLIDAERFLIVNGDTLTDCDPRAVVQRHLDTHARVTMAVVPGNVGRYGGVLVGPNGRVMGFARARSLQSAKSTLPAPPAPNALHFIGVQAVNAQVFEALPDDKTSETVRTLYPRLIAEDANAIVAFESNAEFLDVGTAADYLQTVAAVSRRERVPFDVGTGCQIDTAAEVRDSILWDRVVVPAKSQLINCIVTDGVHVPPGERFERCAIVADGHSLVLTQF